MRSHQLYVGAIGVRLSVAVVDDEYAAVDLSEVDGALIRIIRPDESYEDVTATVYLPTTEGIIYIETTSTLLTMPGTYTMHPWLSWTDGDEFWIEALPFEVSAVGQLN